MDSEQKAVPAAAKEAMEKELLLQRPRVWYREHLDMAELFKLRTN